MEGRTLPDVVFKTRVRDESVGGPNPFRWQDVTSREIFEGLLSPYTTGTEKPDILYQTALKRIRQLAAQLDRHAAAPARPAKARIVFIASDQSAKPNPGMAHYADVGLRSVV